MRPKGDQILVIFELKFVNTDFVLLVTLLKKVNESVYF